MITVSLHFADLPIKTYSPMHKKIVSTSSHNNNKTVRVHIFFTVRKSSPDQCAAACYFSHLQFRLQRYNHPPWGRRGLSREYVLRLPSVS